MKNLAGQTLRLYWQHTKPYPWQVFWLLFSLIGGVGTALYKPVIYKQFFDTLAAPVATADTLIGLVWILAIIGVINEGFWRITTYTAVHFAARVMSNLANTGFDYLHFHSYDFFNNSFVGSLVTKLNRFVRSYEKIFDQLMWSLIPTAINISVITIVLYFRQPILAAIIVIWATIYLTINLKFINHKIKYDLASAEAESKTTGHLADTITNQINLKLFAAIAREQTGYHRLTEKLRLARLKTWLLDSHMLTFQATMMVVLELAVMYTAVRLWERGLLTVGDFALIQTYLIQIFRDLWSVGKHIRRIYESLADAEEMTEILATPHQIKDIPSASKLSVTQGAIEFRDVSFSYTGKKKVFSNFDLSITAGERLALIGPSGGGKSTITKLLFRFFDIQGGEILIDGQNIADVTQDSLRSQIALVPQEPILFHRSLFENIRYAKPSATKEEVIQAAKLAHCHEFIKNFPDGYDTFVGERGVKLSGGERQRVAIARAILKDAPILVLDEATSSLDSESERYIQDALHTLMEGRTTIVIAHRLSTIMQMDRIVVIQNGRIVEEGKHQELLKVKQGVYQKLWEIQAGSFN